MSNKVITPDFRPASARARDGLSDALAMHIAPAVQTLGWQAVAQDLLSIVGGIVATASDKPAHDLHVSAAFLRKYDWKRAKKMFFAAQQGIRPEDVPESFIADDKKPVDKAETTEENQ